MVDKVVKAQALNVVPQSSAEVLRSDVSSEGEPLLVVELNLQPLFVGVLQTLGLT